MCYYKFMLARICITTVINIFSRIKKIHIKCRRVNPAGLAFMIFLPDFWSLNDRLTLCHPQNLILE